MASVKIAMPIEAHMSVSVPIQQRNGEAWRVHSLSKMRRRKDKRQAYQESWSGQGLSKLFHVLLSLRRLSPHQILFEASGMFSSSNLSTDPGDWHHYIHFQGTNGELRQ